MPTSEHDPIKDLYMKALGGYGYKYALKSNYVRYNSEIIEVTAFPTIDREGYETTWLHPVEEDE